MQRPQQFSFALLATMVLLFVSLYSLWVPVESFITMMVAKGKIIKGGALAVKLGFASVFFLLVHIMLSVHFVEKFLKPKLQSRPLIFLLILVLIYALGYISRWVNSWIVAQAMATSRNEGNLEAYFSDPWQRAVSLVFPFLLAIQLYFRLFRNSNSFIARGFRYIINQPPLVLVLFYGMICLIIAATLRRQLDQMLVLGAVTYGLIFLIANFLVAKYADDQPGLKAVAITLPALVIESLAGTKYSILGEFTQYPIGLISLLVSVSLGYTFGILASRRNFYRSI